MQVPNNSSLRTAYERYGPRTDRADVGAGYAAAIGAIAVATLYIASVWLVDSGHLGGGYSPFFAELELRWAVFFSVAGLAFALPSAFLVGLAGWRLVSPETTFGAALTGGVGAVATYLVAVVPAAVALSLLSGEQAAFAFVVAAAAFLLTWWLAVPVGCLVGLAYAVGRPTASG